MSILAAPKNERWPGDPGVDEVLPFLLEAIHKRIAERYHMPDLDHDHVLRDGIVAHLVPTLLRHRFNLWAPPPSPAITLSEQYDVEHDLANDIAVLIQEETGITVADTELNDLKLLMRAAFIRRRPSPAYEVWVVCPSGMATAQLLIVRLQARFPRLTNLKVVSMRELTPHIAESVSLILTTVLAVIPPGKHFAVLAGVAIGAVVSFLAGAFLLRIRPVPEDESEEVATGAEAAAVPGL
jgi:hypothetical protein